MSKRKERQKTRKKVEQTMEEAWEALHANRPEKALILSERAVGTGRMNPQIWYERAQILSQLGNEEDAETALRTCLALAPTFLDGLTMLVRLLSRGSRFEEALPLQARLVEMRPNAEEIERLRTLESHAPMTRFKCESSSVPAPMTRRTSQLPWDEIARFLTRDGAVKVHGLISLEEAESLRDLFWRRELFEREDDVDSPQKGRVVYRFFKRPLPPLLQAIREEVYGRVAPIVNEWQRILEKTERYPETFDAFQRQCDATGHHPCGVNLQRYTRGGFSGLHRGSDESAPFPLQLAITLGPESLEEGGDFILRAQDTGKPRDHVLATEEGDAILFCTRDRLTYVGETPALQPVFYGVTPVQASERLLLGLPFDDVSLP